MIKSSDFQVLLVEENENGTADITVKMGSFVYVFGELNAPPSTEANLLEVVYDLSVAKMHGTDDGDHTWLEEGDLHQHSDIAAKIIESVLSEEEK